MSRFSCVEEPGFGMALKNVSRSRNKQLKELFADGFAIHHAGMLRSDRNLVEHYFSEGLIKVLFCTATLAWGVNLPAHAVVIKGTELYNPEKGAFVDLGVLDVMQIFGRAGRPQFDTYGEATLITTHDKLAHFLSLMTHQLPIESQLKERMTGWADGGFFFSNVCIRSQHARFPLDNLNAEIALGTVSSVADGVRWLSYTYLYTRMRKNPLVYGIRPEEVREDPELMVHRHQLIEHAASALDKARMIRYDRRNGFLHTTDQGRVSSHFYIKYGSVEVFNEQFKSRMTEAEIFAMVSMSQEFDSIKVRDDEMDELDYLMDNAWLEECCFGGRGG